LLHERECVLQSRLRIGGIAGPCQAGQIAVPTIEQPGKALTRERERVVVMECEYDIGVPEIRGRVKGGEVRPGVVAPVMPIDYKLDRPPERADLMVKRELSVIPDVNPLRAIRRLIEGLEGNMESIREKPEDSPPPRSPCGHRGGIGGANQATSRVRKNSVFASRFFRVIVQDSR
jgi:hypothetical protein